MIKRVLLVAAFVLSLVLLIGCEVDPPEEPNDEPEYGMGQVDQPMPIDGTNEGYPTDPLEVAGSLIYLAHDDDYMYVYAEAEVEGWLAVGFNESGSGMDGSNMVLGYYDDGNPVYRDDVGVGNTHSEAGVTAVNEFYFNRTEGVTIMEFSYPMVFPDGEGYNVEQILPGESYSLIVGMHASSDDITTMHTNFGMTDFQIQP